MGGWQGGCESGGGGGRGKKWEGRGGGGRGRRWEEKRWDEREEKVGERRGEVGGGTQGRGGELLIWLIHCKIISL